MKMREAICILCALTSLSGTVLLIRKYLRTKTTLLLLGAIFFVSQTVTNALLYVDLIMFPEINLMTIRNLVTLIGLVILVYGLIWETT